MNKDEMLRLRDEACQKWTRGWNPALPYSEYSRALIPVNFLAGWNARDKIERPEVSDLDNRRLEHYDRLIVAHETLWLKYLALKKERPEVTALVEAMEAFNRPAWVFDDDWRRKPEAQALYQALNEYRQAVKERE